MPLNSSECTCNSMREYANILNAIQVTDPSGCAVNDECDGVRCYIEFPEEVYYDELVVFPCARPPAFEYVLEDAGLHPLRQVIFDKSGNYTLDETESVISFIERGPRSMSVEVCEVVIYKLHCGDRCIL